MLLLLQQQYNSTCICKQQQQQQFISDDDKTGWLVIAWQKLSSFLIFLCPSKCSGWYILPHLSTYHTNNPVSVKVINYTLKPETIIYYLLTWRFSNHYLVTIKWDKEASQRFERWPKYRWLSSIMHQTTQMNNLVSKYFSALTYPVVLLCTALCCS